MGAAEIGTLVTVTLFLAGVIYQAGRLSTRVDHIERSIAKMEITIEGFFRRIEHMTPRRRDE